MVMGVIFWLSYDGFRCYVVALKGLLSRTASDVTSQVLWSVWPYDFYENVYVTIHIKETSENYSILIRHEVVISI